jgi:hypothetical protein
MMCQESECSVKEGMVSDPGDSKISESTPQTKSKHHQRRILEDG